MGNSLDRCHQLFRTYCPANVASLQEVAEARERGAKRLAGVQTGDKMRNTFGQKCATVDKGGT
jgi:hypothetical protein